MFLNTRAPESPGFFLKMQVRIQRPGAQPAILLLTGNADAVGHSEKRASLSFARLTPTYPWVPAQTSPQTEGLIRPNLVRPTLLLPPRARLFRMASCTLCVTSPQPDGMPRESWEHFVLLVVLDECASRWKKKPSSPPPTFATISFWHKVLGAGVGWRRGSFF